MCLLFKKCSKSEAQPQEFSDSSAPSKIVTHPITQMDCEIKVQAFNMKKMIPLSPPFYTERSPQSVCKGPGYFIVR